RDLISHSGFHATPGSMEDGTLFRRPTQDNVDPKSSEVTRVNVDTQPEDDADALIAAIQAICYSSSWSDVGGQGTIQYLPVAGALVISIDYYAHDDIALLLEGIRESRQLQNRAEKGAAHADQPAVPAHLLLASKLDRAADVK